MLFLTGRAPPFRHITHDSPLLSPEMGRALGPACRGVLGHWKACSSVQSRCSPSFPSQGSWEVLLVGAGSGLRGAGLRAECPEQMFLSSGLSEDKLGGGVLETEPGGLGPGPGQWQERRRDFRVGVGNTGDPGEVCSTGDAHGTTRNARRGGYQVWARLG